MADAKQPKCAHHDCKCDVPLDRSSRGDKFCSDYCATDDGHAGHLAPAARSNVRRPDGA